MAKINLSVSDLVMSSDLVVLYLKFESLIKVYTGLNDLLIRWQINVNLS